MAVDLPDEHEPLAEQAHVDAVQFVRPDADADAVLGPDVPLLWDERLLDPEARTLLPPDPERQAFVPRATDGPQVLLRCLRADAGDRDRCDCGKPAYSGSRSSATAMPTIGICIVTWKCSIGLIP